jgi:hypothetical protein
MNIQKYDYYGNYENDNDLNLFSVKDIHKKQMEREKNRQFIYNKITKKCFQKIKATSENEEEYCFFKLPEFIVGYPLFNMTECVMYLINVLREKGFHCRFVQNFVIYISWYKPKSDLKLIENQHLSSFQDLPKNNLLETIPLKYKPIEKSQSFVDFIPRKKNM